MVLPDLPDKVLKGSFHGRFFDRGLQDIDYRSLRVVKIYTRKSLFVKSYGFKLGSIRHHCRYTFNELGQATNFTLFDKGQSIFERPIDFYRRKFTSNDVLISLANIISGLYKVPVNDFYFDSLIEDYVDGVPAHLFEFLEKEWNIHLGANWEYDDFEELVETLMIYLKSNNVNDPGVARKGSK